MEIARRFAAGLGDMLPIVEPDHGKQPRTKDGRKKFYVRYRDQALPGLRGLSHLIEAAQSVIDARDLGYGTAQIDDRFATEHAKRGFFMIQKID